MKSFQFGIFLARALLVLAALVLFQPCALAAPLHDAVTAGDRVAFERLLSSGADIEASDEQGETPLHTAVRYDRLDMARRLLEKGAHTDAYNYWKETPLAAAVLNYRKTLNLDMIRTLLDYGADPLLLKWSEKAAFFGEPQEVEIMRILTEAGLKPTQELVVLLADNGEVESVDLVFAENPGFVLKTEAHNKFWNPGVGKRLEVFEAISMHLKGKGKYALEDAARKNDLKRFVKLLEKGADPNGPGGNPLLHQMVSKGKGDFVQALLDHGADPNFGDWQRTTALHEAVKRERCDMARLLMENGADINALDDRKSSPLDLTKTWKTSMRGCMEELQRQYDRKEESGAKDRDSDKAEPAPAKAEKPWSPATDKVPEAMVETVKAIRKTGDVNAQDQNGQTILFRHIQNPPPNLEMVLRGLIDVGADINHVDRHGITPLLFAVNMRKGDAIKVLLKLGARHEIKEKNSLPAVLYAVMLKHYPEMRLLVENGLDVNAPGPSGETPLLRAIPEAPKEEIAFLLDHGAAVNRADISGLTPLHVSAWLRDADMAGLLVKAGADTAAKDNWGLTPMGVAHKHKNMVAYRYLRTITTANQ